MLQISRKVTLVLTSILLISMCISCKASEPYLIQDYLNYLSIKSGIGSSGNFDDNFDSLLDYGIVDKNDYEIINEPLDKQYLCVSLNKLLDDNQINENDIENINEENVKKIVDDVVEIINNKEFENKYEYKLKDDIDDNIYFDNESNEYKRLDDKQITIDDIYSYYDIEDSFEIDFSSSEIIPYQDELDTSYINNKFELLASKNHVFNKDGYRISYTLGSSGISVRVSKKVNQCNIFADLGINNVKTSFKYTNKDGDLKNCYFSLKMNTTNQFGFSNGKYEKYYLNFKDLDADDFKKSLDNLLLDRSQEVEARIPICQIKTPIPNVPSAYINLELILKFNASGKMELVLYNSHNIGFEIKEGSPRFFYDHDDDIDAIIKAGGKACLGVCVSIDALNFKLCDVELDGGIKAEAKTTLHLYDSEGNSTSNNTSIELSTLEDISKDNPNVAVCGDLSLYWMFDVIINTTKTKMNKMGFTKTIHVLDEDNQVFGNFHHIENGQFVKKCTRKSTSKKVSKSVNIVSKNKIILNTYAEVLNVNETFEILIESLPDNYSTNDILYITLEDGIVSLSDGHIKALKPGSCKIKVYTSDGKYNTYVNILVSTG